MAENETRINPRARCDSPEEAAIYSTFGAKVWVTQITTVDSANVVKRNVYDLDPKHLIPCGFCDKQNRWHIEAVTTQFRQWASSDHGLLANRAPNHLYFVMWAALENRVAFLRHITEGINIVPNLVVNPPADKAYDTSPPDEHLGAPFFKHAKTEGPPPSSKEHLVVTDIAEVVALMTLGYGLDCAKTETRTGLSGGLEFSASFISGPKIKDHLEQVLAPMPNIIGDMEGILTRNGRYSYVYMKNFASIRGASPGAEVMALTGHGSFGGRAVRGHPESVEKNIDDVAKFLALK